MKKIFFNVVTLFALLFLLSCGKSNEVKPTDVKITGPLGEFFEVVDRTYQIEDGRINVEIKRIKEGLPSPWVKGIEVGYGDGECEPHFTIELRNEGGDILGKVKTDIVFDKSDLAQIIALGVDESSSINFNVSKEGIASFKLGSTFLVHEGSSDSTPSSSLDGTYDMQGQVDKYPITMHIEIDGSSVVGNYYYNKQGADAQLKLSGTCEEDVLDLNETNPNGIPTGHFKGTLSNGVFKGEFITSKGESMNFAVTEGDVETLSIDDTDDDSHEDYDSSASSSSSSEDWDEILDSYERYVDDYITLFRKAKNGDMSAITEYASLLEEANTLSEKLQNAKDGLSNSQLSRYNKITMKMAQAAQ